MKDSDRFVLYSLSFWIRMFITKNTWELCACCKMGLC